MNCVCQNGPQRPGVQEVLDTLQRSTVCTGTQCFETETDAFGLTTAPAANSDQSSLFFMMMAYAAAPRCSPPRAQAILPTFPAIAHGTLPCRAGVGERAVFARAPRLGMASLCPLGLRSPPASRPR